MDRATSYFKWKSLTFWSGLLLIISGVMELAGTSVPGLSEVIRPVLDAVFQTSDAGSRIFMGSGMIGIRRALGDR